MGVVAWSPNGYHNDSICSSERRCKCIRTAQGKYKADCSSLDLNKFPNFYENVEVINLFNNSLDTIYASSSLPLGLTYLNISACKLKEIHKGFLRNFLNLEHLDISYNSELTLEVFPNVTYDLQFTAIKVLKSTAIQCKYGKGLTFNRRYSYHLRNTSLEELHISSNRIEFIEQFVISDMPDSLTHITAANNRLVFSWAFLDVQHLKNLEYADFSSSSYHLTRFLSLLEDNCSDSKPHIEKDVFQRSYSNAKVSKPTPFESCLKDALTVPPKGKVNVYVCVPRSLKTVILSNTGIGTAHIPYIHHIIFDLRHLRYLKCKGNLYTDLTSAVVIQGNGSYYIDFSDNYISEIDYSWFDRANLSDLDLSGNFLDRFFRNEYSKNLLKNQKYIQKISLARNKISNIPDAIFEDTINLRHIDLSYNDLENLHFIRESLRKIAVLNLTGNYIHTLSKREMTVLDLLLSDHFHH